MTPLFPGLQTPYLLAHQGGALITAAHRLGMQIHYWTIDDKATMQDLITLGVDGIFTNRPDLLKEVISSSSLE